MNKQAIITVLITALTFVSCRPTARQTVADVAQPTDSTEALTSADTLRLVITDKHLAQTDSLIRRALRLPLDSITVEIVNNTESTCITGEAYTIEQILATNSLHTAPACSLSMLSLTNTTLSEGRYTASSKSSSRKGRGYRKAFIAIFRLSNPYPSK